MPRTLLVDVDTQFDFMRSTGALSVPGAQALEGDLARLVLAARRAHVPHFATLDAHTPDDPEFAAYGFPPHCVAGTPGAAKVAATQQLDPLVLTADAVAPSGARELAFPKAAFDVFTNPAFARAVTAASAEVAVVCGVATDYCVKAAALGLLALGLEVWLVEGAIAPVTAATGEAALAELAARGAKLVSTEAAVARLEMEALDVARR